MMILIAFFVLLDPKSWKKYRTCGRNEHYTRLFPSYLHSETRNHWVLLVLFATRKTEPNFTRRPKTISPLFLRSRVHQFYVQVRRPLFCTLASCGVTVTNINVRGALFVGSCILLPPDTCLSRPEDTPALHNEAVHAVPRTTYATMLAIQIKTL